VAHEVYHGRWRALRPGDDIAAVRREITAVRGAVQDLSSRLNELKIEDTRDRKALQSIIAAENALESASGYLTAAISRIMGETSKRAA